MSDSQVVLPSGLSLDAQSAADLMFPQVVSIAMTASVQQAAALLTAKNVSAVPVTDAEGQPIGVLSKSDLVAHAYRTSDYVQPGPQNEVAMRSRSRRQPKGFSQVSELCVRDIMTPTLYSVAPETPAGDVVNALVSLGVHRLFVTNDEGKIIGVISAIDVLRQQS